MNSRIAKKILKNPERYAPHQVANAETVKRRRTVQVQKARASNLKGLKDA